MADAIIEVLESYARSYDGMKCQVLTGDVAFDIRHNIANSIRTALAQQPAQGEAVNWRDHVEQRIRTWRQSFVNTSGDQLAIDDFMGADSIDDLVDFVCDAYTAPPAPSVSVPDEQKLMPDSGERDTAFVRDWNACRAAMLASGGKARVQWETCESQCTCKVCGTVWTAPEPPR